MDYFVLKIPPYASGPELRSASRLGADFSLDFSVDTQSHARPSRRLRRSSGTVRTPYTRTFPIPGAPGRQDQALLRLGQYLLAQGYRFTTITPASHEFVRARPPKRPPTLRDIFGWSLPFTAEGLSGDLLSCLAAAGALA